jgi:hypothetical protein
VRVCVDQPLDGSHHQTGSRREWISPKFVRTIITYAAAGTAWSRQDGKIRERPNASKLNL